jgi:hypothetical protein
MPFHVNLATSEGDSFSLQLESLLESVLSAQLYGASCAQNALPRHCHGAAQRRRYLACAAGKSGGLGDCTVGGNFSAGNAADGGDDSFARVGFWAGRHSKLEYLSGYAASQDCLLIFGRARCPLDSRRDAGAT